VIARLVHARVDATTLSFLCAASQPLGRRHSRVHRAVRSLTLRGSFRAHIRRVDHRPTGWNVRSNWDNTMINWGRRSDRQARAKEGCSKRRQLGDVGDDPLRASSWRSKAEPQARCITRLGPEARQQGQQLWGLLARRLTLRTLEHASRPPHHLRQLGDVRRSAADQKVKPPPPETYCCLALAGRTSLHGSADDFLSGNLRMAASYALSAAFCRSICS
jgi:hypothetical protein